MRTVFNRGFWDGYYQGQKMGEWSNIYGSQATERKVYIGKAIKYFSNLGVGEFHIEAGEVKAGDKILITGPTTGAVYIELDDPRVNMESVETVRKGDRVSFKVPGKVRLSDKLYRIDKTGHACE